MGNSMPGPLLEICLPKDDEVPAEAPAAPPLPRPARLDDQAARAQFEEKFANGLRLIKFGRNGASQRFVDASSGWSALHAAATRGDVDVAKFLLEHRDDGPRDRSLVDGPDVEACTPLHQAAHNGHAAIVDLLLDAGAAVYARDAHGQTSLWKAAWCARARSARTPPRAASRSTRRSCTSRAGRSGRTPGCTAAASGRG